MLDMKELPDQDSSEKLLNRRTILTGLAAGAAGGAVGVAVGFERKSALEAIRDEVTGAGPGRLGFHLRARDIQQAHNQQTRDSVAELKNRFRTESGSKKPVWSLIEKMSQCIDPTDTVFYCTSQLTHVQQILASMEDQGLQDPDMYLIALLHDLGKVVHLDGEPPENVFGRAQILGEFQQGIGLDNVIFQFSHAEIIYQRIKNLVPDHVAWTVRYHNIPLDDAAPYMDDRDRRYAEKYLLPFRKFDGGTKSPYRVPEIDMNKYRDLVDTRLPEAIYF
jgi:hypothetical protein